jgi:hypothetical protein
MKRLTLVSAIILFSSGLFVPLYGQASDDYDQLEAAFNQLCGQLENAEALSVEELTTMIAECDELKQKITRNENPKKKVLLFRLKKCRDFIEFTIQTKQTVYTL